MGRNRDAFEGLLYGTLIPDFCGDARRGCQPAGFVADSVKVAEYDAGLFLQAWEHGLIKPVRPGLYRSSAGRPGEQLFWEGRKGLGVRRFTLWLEPVITVGSLARLHFDFGWPKHLIGAQSLDGAFDMVAFLTESNDEYIAGEVKKTVREAELLLDLMFAFGRDPTAPEPRAGKERNAYKKIAALRARKAPVFWLVGPDGYNRIQKVSYSEDKVISFEAGTIEDLKFQASAPALLSQRGRITYSELERRVQAQEFPASDGNHSMRLWRVAENLRDELSRTPADVRLPQLVSRIGILCRGLAVDVRSGHTPIEDAATLLDQLADLAELNFADQRD